MNNSERAVILFQEGYNCSQAVLGAYCEELGLDFETAMRLASSFGGGMGRLREVCGAVSAMFMAAGLSYGYAGPRDDRSKQRHYEPIQKLAQSFKEKNGSILCRELLGMDILHDGPTPEKRTGEYYQKRPCAELVRCAAEMAGGLLASGARDPHSETCCE